MRAKKLKERAKLSDIQNSRLHQKLENLSAQNLRLANENTKLNERLKKGNENQL